MTSPTSTARDPPLTDDDHRRLVRTGGPQADHNDVAYGALDALPKESGFIIAGDWNSARPLDEVAPAGIDGGVFSTEFFTPAAVRGWP